jgi:hypothetical protein
MTGAPASWGPGGVGARTAAEAADPRLRGRTYAVPFDPVWRAATALLDGGLRRTTLRTADDIAGHLEADSFTLLRRRPLDVHVSVTLDQDAQTRVDAAVAIGGRGPDFGAAVRFIDLFFRRLDAALRSPRSAGPAARRA